MKVSDRGFTLIELIVVVAIMMTTIVAFPMGLYMRSKGIALAVDQIRSDIHQARLMAISRKQPCAIVLNYSQQNEYYNSLTLQAKQLSRFHSGIHFLEQGPDGRASANRIVFNRRGMSTSVAPQQLFIADADLTKIFRIRVMLPGGISIHRWMNEKWR